MNNRIKKYILPGILTILIIASTIGYFNGLSLNTFQKEIGNRVKWYWSCINEETGELEESAVGKLINLSDESCVDLWNKYQSSYGFYSYNWDEGWGFENCNNISPLKKVLRAIDAIHIAKNPNVDSNKIINYMPERMDEWTKVVKPMCIDGLMGRRAKRKGIKINIIAFGTHYNLMATLVHEASHEKGGHNADEGEGECNGASCDQSYYDFRANAYELAYSWNYALHANNSNRFTREQMLWNAHWCNDSCFVTSPNFSIQPYLPGYEDLLGGGEPYQYD